MSSIQIWCFNVILCFREVSIMHMEALGRLKRSAPHLEFPALHKELFSVDSWAQTGNQLISTPNTIENDDNSTYYYNSSSIIKSTTPTTIINASTILQQQQPQTSIIFLTSSSSSSFLKSDTTNVSDSINISTSPDNEINYFSTSTPTSSPPPSAPVVDTSVVQQTETLSPSSTSSDYHQHNNTITMIL